MVSLQPRPHVENVETRVLRDYQDDAAKFCISEIMDGQDLVVLAMPTGSGKTLTTQYTLAKLRHHFPGAVIATPFIAIEEGFRPTHLMNVFRPMEPGVASDSCCVIDPTWFMEDLRETGDKRGHFDTALSGSSSRPFLPTTHSQLTSWDIEALPEDLCERILVIDEAHHLMFDKEGRPLNELSVFLKAWMDRMGTAILLTATPYRTDGAQVYLNYARVYTRTLAEHMNSGWAPRNLRVESHILTSTAESTEEMSGNVLPKDLGSSLVEIATRWVADGQQKAIINVPSKGSAEFADALKEVLEQLSPGVRVLNAVGDTPSIKETLNAALEQERAVTRYEDSQVDVIIACRRFDEGVDWPLCSQVYICNIPASMRLIVQRLGRALRSKAGISDYPEEYRDQATLTFLVSRVTQDLLEQYERQHHDHAFLLACFLADWEVGKTFGAAYRIRWERAWSRRPKVPLDDPDQDDLQDLRERQLAVVPAPIRQHMLKEIALVEARLRKSGIPSTVSEIVKVLEVKNLSSLEKQAVLQILLERVGGGDQALEDRITAQLKKLPKNPVREDLVEIFRAVIADYSDRTVAVLDGVLNTFYTEMTGADAQEVADRLGRRHLLSRGVIITAMDLYASDWGRWPHVGLGDASSYFGFPITWRDVDSALSNGYRSLPGGSSLKRLWDASHELSPQIISEAANKFRAVHGRWPTYYDGGTTEYFGFPVSWKIVNQCLSEGRRGCPGGETLSGFLRGGRGELNNAQIVAHARAYASDHGGTRPSAASGDASAYFGFPITWVAVDSSCRRGHRGLPGGTSLGRLLDEAGVPRGPRSTSAPLSELRIIEAAKEYASDHGGTRPNKKSGDASAYFGFPITWQAANGALGKGLRGLPGGTTLAKLLTEAGL